MSGLDDYADDGALADHELLRVAAGSFRDPDDEIAPLPVRAARLAPSRRRARRDRDRAASGSAPRRGAARDGGDFLVCEGVGGFLVPLTLGYLVRDFARDLGLPVVIAAPPALGTINHTLLTIEAVRAVGLEVAAVVLTPWPDEPGRRRALEPRGDRAPRARPGAHAPAWIDAGDPDVMAGSSSV